MRRALARGQSLDDVVPDPPSHAESIRTPTSTALFAGLGEQRRSGTRPWPTGRGCSTARSTSCASASTRRSPNPSAGPKSGGVGWTEHRAEDLVELVPPDDLMARLAVLPQSYLTQRRVRDKLLLATTPEAGKESLRRARTGTARASRPRSGREAHFLSPLHPVLDWAGRPGADPARPQRGPGDHRGDVDTPDVAGAGDADQPPRPGGRRRRSLACRFPAPDPPPIVDPDGRALLEADRRLRAARPTRADR